MSSSKTAEQLEKEKQVVARAVLRYVRDGMLLGLGSGSTATHLLELLAQAVRRGELKIEVVATSLRIESRAKAAGLPFRQPQRGLRLDLAIDGADEIAPDLSLTKGAGGALLREKIVARRSRYFFVIADSTKPVPQLGRRPVPIEVIPFAVPWVMDDLAQLGGKPQLRTSKVSPDRPFLTDQQNHIVDCDFGLIGDPAGLAAKLRGLPGVVEHGLFLDLARAAFVADGDSVMVLRPGCPPTPLAQTDLALD